VLHVDEQPVEIAGLGDLGNVDGARLAQPHSQGEFTLLKFAKGNSWT
jgi:hypothetical protein